MVKRKRGKGTILKETTRESRKREIRVTKTSKVIIRTRRLTPRNKGTNR